METTGHFHGKDYNIYNESLFVMKWRKKEGNTCTTHEKKVQENLPLMMLELKKKKSPKLEP